MPMYNLIEYSDNYQKTSGSLWQYFKDIPAIKKLFIIRITKLQHTLLNHN